MAQFNNIVIIIADALRYDYAHDLTNNKVIPTLAPSLHTPTSMASFISAKSPKNHKVRGFIERLDDEHKTAFDYFENCSFYDGEVSTISDNIFRENYQELTEIEEPFIWIERAMETHLIYGIGGHNRDFEYICAGQKLYKEDQEGKIDIKEEYSKGVSTLQKHIQKHVDELEERGILDETLIIITSDHGELLGENYLSKTRYDHNLPPLKEIVQVPTIFYNHDVDIESMRLIDVLPTALALTGKDVSDWGDGKNVTEEEPPKKGRNLMKHIPFLTYDTKWVFKDGEWQPTKLTRLKRGVKTVLTDIANLFYHRGNQLEKKIEEHSTSKENNDELSAIDI